MYQLCFCKSSTCVGGDWFSCVSWGLFSCTEQTGIKVLSGERCDLGLWSRHKREADFKTRVNVTKRVEVSECLYDNLQLLNFFCVLLFFPPVCGGRKQSVKEQTVSLGSMPCLSDSDCVVLRPRLELLLGDGWRYWLVTTNIISGQALWLLLVFVEGQEVCHLHAADLHTHIHTPSWITPPVKSCHIHCGPGPYSWWKAPHHYW